MDKQNDVGKLKRALAREPSGSHSVRLLRFLYGRITTAHQLTGITPPKAKLGTELPGQLDITHLKGW